MKLFDAYNRASHIKDVLSPFCDKIEIAGSIRRARPEVNDIDLVILPKAGQQPAIKARCAQRASIVTNGDQNYIVRLNSGLQLDIFFASPKQLDFFKTGPGNFGSLLLCRTGSREHNIWLVEYAKTRGFTWSPYRGVIDVDGYVVASETEEDIFHMLGLDFIPPANRER